MKPKWQKLASLAQEICTLLFQLFSAVFASKGYPFKNIFVCLRLGELLSNFTICLSELFFYHMVPCDKCF